MSISSYASTPRTIDRTYERKAMDTAFAGARLSAKAQFEAPILALMIELSGVVDQGIQDFSGQFEAFQEPASREAAQALANDVADQLSEAGTRVTNVSFQSAILALR